MKHSVEGFNLEIFVIGKLDVPRIRNLHWRMSQMDICRFLTVSKQVETCVFVLNSNSKIEIVLVFKAIAAAMVIGTVSGKDNTLHSGVCASVIVSKYLVCTTCFRVDLRTVSVHLFKYSSFEFSF